MAEGSAANATVAKEIERAITAALSKNGQGGTVIVREEHCELHRSSSDGGGPVISIELGDWVGQWNLLPDDIKEQRAQKAATRLVNALHRSQGGSAPLAAGELRDRYRKLAASALGIFVVALVAVWLYRSGFFGGDKTAAETSAEGSAAPSAPPVEDAAARAERERTVCEAARQRMYQGGALGMDIAGWVVELWLARDGEGLAKDPALLALVAKGVSTEVEAKSEGTMTLHPGDTELGLSTVVVRFAEGYVPPFFTAKGRERFMNVAESTADAVGAVHAGLYGRCAHLPNTRDVGAWYRGIDENGALVSLLFASGRYAQPPAFDPEKHAGGGLLATLRRRVGTLAEADRNDILRKAGGRPHTHEADGGKKASSLRFPLGGPTRATRASRQIATKLEL